MYTYYEVPLALTAPYYSTMVLITTDMRSTIYFSIIYISAGDGRSERCSWDGRFVHELTVDQSREKGHTTQSLRRADPFSTFYTDRGVFVVLESRKGVEEELN